ncbi:ABC transporter ATP-binding protein [Parablautia sp. Marseille-Q6255]|uniref:ABC transporter ATP-binding protein n=1 Tax=Parablautia sp. Marseille-Q6255 TaxID=3039593 RepID=UPI0024BCF13E|nr:ABC transporter ATP-binding protein [Parablautia sp. Marseille-Q6255]
MNVLGNTEKNPKLVLSDVCKNFGGVVAARDINLEIFGGEVVGLIGPNGAGKTTLINLITGVYKVDKGKIYFKGKDITAQATYQRAIQGIGRTFQHPHLLDRCDIWTNIIMGSDMAARKKHGNKVDLDKVLPELLECAGLQAIYLDDPMSKLSYGQQKLLEVVRVLLSQPDILLLDEPAAGLNNRETQYVSDLIRYAVKHDIGVLLIEHSMELVMSICDRITVLNFGHQITTGLPEEVQNNTEVIEAYLGGGLADAED